MTFLGCIASIQAATVLAVAVFVLLVFVLLTMPPLVGFIPFPKPPGPFQELFRRLTNAFDDSRSVQAFLRITALDRRNEWSVRRDRKAKSRCLLVAVIIALAGCSQARRTLVRNDHPTIRQDYRDADNAVPTDPGTPLFTRLGTKIVAPDGLRLRQAVKESRRLLAGYFSRLAADCRKL